MPARSLLVRIADALGPTGASIRVEGHTDDAAVRDRDAIFTGDTLFIGDVGRPDLAQHVVSELTEEKLADHLFDSLRNKIMPLSDDLIVYPNHGAGSACGKMMSKETTDTLNMSFGKWARCNMAARWPERLMDSTSSTR